MDMGVSGDDGSRLSAEVLARLENPRSTIVTPDGARGTRNLFTGEVDRIEREWGLLPDQSRGTP